MSTRSRIGILNEDGSIESVYCHFDGYLEKVGDDLKNSYTTEEGVRNLIAEGDRSAIDGDSYSNRGDNWEGVKPLESRNKETYISDTKESWGEFAYLWDNEKWHYAEIFGDCEFQEF